MATEIYNKLSALYLAELDRLETQLNDIEIILHQTNYDSAVVVEFATRKAKLEHFKSFMKDSLDYLKRFDR